MDTIETGTESGIQGNPITTEEEARMTLTISVIRGRTAKIKLPAIF